MGIGPVDVGRRWPLLGAWLTAGERAHAAADLILDQSLASGARASGTAAVREVQRGLPEDAVLFLGSSSVVRDVDLVGERLPTHVLANRGVSGIDGTVSTAVGAALAHGRADDLPTYALIGDLTFLHDSNGLVIGPGEPQPDLCVVVRQRRRRRPVRTARARAPEHSAVFERVFGTPHGVDLAALCAATRNAARPRRTRGRSRRTGAAEGPAGCRDRRRPASHRALHARHARRPSPPLWGDCWVAAGRPQDLSQMRTGAQLVRASRIGTSLATDSASSASGSDPATMPQPANSRSRAGSPGRPRRSAARCPTRRRRRRRSSRPARRSGRGPCPRSRR